MSVRVNIGDKVFDGTIRDVLLINEATLTDEFIKQPSTYAYFAALSEFAVADVEQKKLALSVLEANLDSQKRLELKDTKVTEAVIKSAIVKDKKYQMMVEEIIEAERQLGILKSLVEGLKQRKDMLIQIGSTKRQEMVLSDFGINVTKIRENNQ
jgi:hypothetical protein